MTSVSLVLFMHVRTL